MYLSNESLLVIIVVGVIAGWLAGKVVAGGGFGLIGDLADNRRVYRRLAAAAPTCSSRQRDRLGDHQRDRRRDRAAGHHPRHRPTPLLGRRLG